ncbi:PilW family protein [Geobacter sp. SVR]|uniref:PilW family protein n=1 Tax=Geobacter sp. SVR TaxID=2495594 RepID=UPI00143EFCF5|nr:PilW family protein [Geobacter sp. SVR]BCS53485.1 type IV pilus minor pilin PilW [Geobacter sp. SVR]GCF85388.1 type IV pilus minor pilin PilW [Geobacter sp. SVR]
MLNSRKGFTLVELLVVMSVFIVIVMITGDSFKTILTQMTKITRSEESNIEGVVGLEMFRHDLQQVGFGLPFSFLAPISYSEASGTPASDYNDGTGTTASKVPRAVVAGDNLAATSGSYNIIAGTDYLALKGTTLGQNQASQKWTYMPYTSGITFKKKRRIWNSNDLASDDRVIVVKKVFSGSTYSSQLITKDAATYWTHFNADNSFSDGEFSPTLPEEVYYIYGIRSKDDDNNDSNDISMPFNRADYFVSSPANAAKKPAFCAPSTGILYKATVNQSDGGLYYIPLVDCIADMQVVFGWDVDDGQGNEGQDGVVETFSTPLGTGGDITVSPGSNRDRVTSAMADPEKLRNSLKIIKVYLLAQIGRKDPNYQSPASFAVGDAANDAISKTYALSSEMRNYHWKVYRIVVRPKNLLANQ